jgi:hypothetical protein
MDLRASRPDGARRGSAIDMLPSSLRWVTDLTPFVLVVVLAVVFSVVLVVPATRDLVRGHEGMRFLNRGSRPGACQLNALGSHRTSSGLRAERMSSRQPQLAGSRHQVVCLQADFDQLQGNMEEAW